MNAQKRMKGLLLAAMVMVGMAGLAQADGELSALGSTDSIKLFVTPTVNYGVTITSVNTRGYDFGSVNINSVTRSTAPILVTNTGNVNENWMLRGANLDTWTLGTSTNTDQAMLMGVFTSSATVTPPADSEFTPGSDYVVNTPQTVVYGDGNRYNLASASVIASGGVSSNPGATNGRSRNLWLKFITPGDSTVATEQSFRLYVITCVP